MQIFTRMGLAAMFCLATAGPASAASITLTFDDGSGLSAMARFLFDTAAPTELNIVLRNTSTSLPAALNDGDANSNQLLTSIGFLLPGGVTITGGSAAITSGSTAVGFDPAEDLSKEWGFGSSGTGQLCGDPACPDPFLQSLTNWVSTMQPATAKFTAGKIGNSNVLNGPSFGLQAAGPSGGGLVPTGGLYAVRDSATFTLSLSAPITDLSFLNTGAVVEFGSDAAFLVPTTTQVPEPAATALFGLGLLGLAYRTRRRTR